MKDIREYMVVEASVNKYEIYFNYEKNRLKVHKIGGDDLEADFESIDEAVHEIYLSDSNNPRIEIIPSDKLIKLWKKLEF